MKFYGSKSLIGASWKPYGIQNSLRFNASQSSYLSWTPASAGNRKTWTWSFWFKRTKIGVTQEVIINAGSYSPQIQFYNDYFNVYGVSGATLSISPNRVFRDPSAWYHIIVALDTTQATASDRCKLYVNGVLETALNNFAGSGTPAYPSQNYEFSMNDAVEHQIGTRSGLYFDGYITEVNFIDGQALNSSYFGENDVITGVWKPKKYVGTYGTNGFYLPMKLDNTVEGFNTVTWVGNGSSNSITGVGFNPDLIWIKNKSNGGSSYDHWLTDTVRGISSTGSLGLFSNTADNERAYAGYGVSAVSNDGFTLIGNGSLTNYSTHSYVGWCWDAGNSTVSNSDGSITSSVRANPTYGFSVVTYTGTGANATVGHGLGVAPSMVIVKSRSAGGTGWPVYHTSTGAGGSLYLHVTSGYGADSSAWNNTSPTSSVFSIGTNTNINVSSQTQVAYCFAEVSGYSKFGSYTGTGASGNTVTLGFKPAFVMIKRTNTTADWVIYDNTRDSVNPNNLALYPNLNNSEGTITPSMNFTDTGIEFLNSTSTFNASGSTYIYMAFKDTREYAYWLDDSGNNNDWQPNGGITTQSSVTDVPTLTSETSGNYATLNPLDKDTNLTLSNSNLKATGYNAGGAATFGLTTGKWYWEVTLIDPYASNNWGIHGLSSGKPGSYVSAYTGYTQGSGVWALGGSGGGTFEAGVLDTAYTTFANGDVLGFAFDADSLTLDVYKNNTKIGNTLSVPSVAIYPSVYQNGLSGDTSTTDYNFGQLPFAYTPPTGFKSLNTYNLPDSTIKNGSDYFNTVLYTGDGNNDRSITGVGFQTDFNWTKSRSSASYSHQLSDVVRGFDRYLYSNATTSEGTDPTNHIQSVNSDGYVINSGASFNASSVTYVAWNWKAGGTGVTNTDGSITSTVSANPTAGFSIVTWTGQSSEGSIGLGISNVGMIISKRRNEGSADWPVLHQSLTTDYGLFLNKTNAQFTLVNTWVDYSTFGSSVLTLRSGSTMNQSGTNHLAYCFAEVEGYSKIDKYTGNGSADGPFVYTGFRPAFVLLKRTNSTGSWQIKDTERNTYNLADLTLFPNLTNAEYSTFYFYDLLSNGFKVRGTDAELNGSGSTYIYLAFAENPFKNSLAR